MKTASRKSRKPQASEPRNVLMGSPIAHHETGARAALTAGLTPWVTPELAALLVTHKPGQGLPAGAVVPVASMVRHAETPNPETVWQLYRVA